MGKVSRVFLISFIFWSLFASQNIGQQLERSQAISAYIYNFAKNIQWQNEKEIKEFHFLVFGTDLNILQELKILAKTQTLRNKPIKISSSLSLDSIDDVQLIFITKKEEHNLIPIFDKVEGKNILIVSDGYKDERLIMINFVDVEGGRLKFEINKANIINQRIRMMEEIILLGGTEVDVAELYREGQQSLRGLQKRTAELEKDLSQINNSIKEKTREIQTLKDSLTSQKKRIQNQNEKLIEQSQLLKNLDIELSSQISKINEQKNIYDLKSKELENQKDELKKGNEELARLKLSTKRQKEEINSQTKILERQGKTINRQQNYLYFLIIIVLLAVLLVTVGYHGYSTKKKLTKELEARVHERTEELNQANILLSVELSERKEIQETLKENVLKFQTLFNVNPDAIIISDAYTQEIIDCNQITCEMNGYSREELIGKKINILHPIEAAKSIYDSDGSNLFIEDLKQKRFAKIEAIHKRKDGTLFPIESSICLLNLGDKLFVMEIDRDITDRKLAEDRLRQSEEQFRLISESVADMIVVLDIDGKRVYNNPAYKPILGDTQSLLGTDSFGDIHPEDREKIRQVFQETIKTGRGNRAEYRLISNNGDIHFIESQGSVIRDEKGDIKNVVVVSRDITERKKIDEELRKYRENLELMVHERTLELQKRNTELNIAQKEIEGVNKELLHEIEFRRLAQIALSESEQRLEDILNYAPILVYINDIEGRYIFVNKEFQRVMGLSFEEVVNKTDLELFSKERAERNIAQNNKIISTKQSQIFENASLKNKEERYFVDILFPIFDTNNNISATCGWSLDITDRKRSEEILKEAKEKAESADRLKSAFLATMSHELRTPLNSIIGFTGILMKGIAGPLNAEQLKQLGMAKGSALHLLALINDVLDISKIEAGQLVVSLDKFNFSMMMMNVVSTVTPLAEKKQLKLKLNLPEDEVIIDSDERRVGQVFLNLINNAIKFTDRGLITIESFVDDNNVVTNVIDTGIGIKTKDMEKLFKPFSQIETGLTRNHDGTGLGLSISQKLVEKLGGNITVNSEVGVGSTFTVTLPITLKAGMI